jgi:hypothetical protein
MAATAQGFVEYLQQAGFFRFRIGEFAFEHPDDLPQACRIEGLKRQ